MENSEQTRRTGLPRVTNAKVSRKSPDMELDLRYGVIHFSGVVRARSCAHARLPAAPIPPRAAPAGRPPRTPALRVSPLPPPSEPRRLCFCRAH